MDSCPPDTGADPTAGCMGTVSRSILISSSSMPSMLATNFRCLGIIKFFNSPILVVVSPNFLSKWFSVKLCTSSPFSQYMVARSFGSLTCTKTLGPWVTRPKNGSYTCCSEFFGNSSAGSWELLDRRVCYVFTCGGFKYFVVLSGDFSIFWW